MQRISHQACFNEAAPDQGRKCSDIVDRIRASSASMRPPLIRGGNVVGMRYKKSHGWLQ